MKNMRTFKSLLVSAGLVLATLLPAKSDEYSLVLTNNATNLLATAAWNISSITVSHGSCTTNALVNFYDNNVVGITYTNAAYTNLTTIKTNVTSIITNSFGNLQTNIYPGQWTLSSVVAAATNTLPIIKSMAVASQATSTSTDNIITTKGLVAVANNACSNTTVTVTYTTSP